LPATKAARRSTGERRDDAKGAEDADDEKAGGGLGHEELISTESNVKTKAGLPNNEQILRDKLPSRVAMIYAGFTKIQCILSGF
jgi:hypothetical protein